MQHKKEPIRQAPGGRSLFSPEYLLIVMRAVANHRCVEATEVFVDGLRKALIRFVNVTMGFSGLQDTHWVDVQEPEGLVLSMNMPSSSHIPPVLRLPTAAYMDAGPGQKSPQVLAQTPL